MLGPARRAVAWILPSCILIATAACGPAKPPAEPEPVEAEPAPPPPPQPAPVPVPSLYERLGKREALEGIVDDLMGNILADKRINKLFDKARRDKDRAKQLHARLVAELCVVAGGTDCNYDGKPMKDAHQGMGIGEAQWSAFVEDLTIALKTHSVDGALIKELVGKLEEQTKADVVAPAKGK